LVIYSYSYLAKLGPSISISPTPAVIPASSNETASWLTYTNSKYNYSIKYPSDWVTVDNEFIAEKTFVPGLQDETKTYNIIEFHKYPNSIYAGYTNKQWFEKIAALPLGEELNDQRTTIKRIDYTGNISSGEKYVTIYVSPSPTSATEKFYQVKTYILSGETIYQLTLDLYNLDGLETFGKMLPTFKFTDSAAGTVTPPKGAVVFCAQDAKKCSDGSYVSRHGPKCEFAACPR